MEEEGRDKTAKNPHHNRNRAKQTRVAPGKTELNAEIGVGGLIRRSDHKEKFAGRFDVARKTCTAPSSQTTKLEKNNRFGLSDQSISRTGITTTSNAGSVAAIMVAFSLSSSSRLSISRPPI